MQPLKPRSPPRAPLLPRSQSHNTLSRVPAPEGVFERLQRHRPMRGALLLLLSAILAANCVWAVQGVAAWRRGRGAGGTEPLMLPLLDSTRLSVEVSRVGSNETERSTYVVNAQLVDSPTGGNTSISGSNASGSNASGSAPGGAELVSVQPAGGRGDGRGAPAAAAAGAALAAGGAGASDDATVKPDLVAQLKSMASSMAGSLVAPTEDSQEASGAPAGGATAQHGKDGRPGSSSAAQAGAAAAGNATAAPAAAPADAAGAANATAANATAASPSPSPPPPPPHRAVLKMPEVDERSRDACAQALQAPKVALLFLTRGDLFHHGVWQQWFEAARDLLPAEQLRAAACPAATAATPAPEPGSEGEQGDEQAAARQVQLAPRVIAEACGWNASAGQPLRAGSGGGAAGGSAIDQQHLFSVYIHAPPDVTDDQLPKVFRGRLISDRLQPEWGTHQLVEATRNLLWEAFQDPLNQRFVLLSESDVPLYDPLTLHQQLLSEDKSRVNVCRHAAFTDTRRWSWRMSSPVLKSWHWRKSSQWFGMLRSHAQVVLEDVEVFRRFEEHCRSEWDPDYKRWRDCFSDEHYIPTLLATKRLDGESTCHIDGIVAVDWSAGGPHPKAYKSWEVQPELLARARGPVPPCNASEAIADAQRRYVTKQAAFAPAAAAGTGDSAAGADAADAAAPPAWQRQLCGATLADVPPYNRPLASTCALTSRKFPKPTVRAVARLFNDCSSGLQLLSVAACAGEREQQP